MTSPYRPEIDGLRAVAVAPVILFHAGLDAFSGGYVGVDVFFVISGYLITRILLQEMTEGRFSLIRFYERRARRILPALFFVILCATPVAWALMSPVHFKDYALSVIATGLFASNILFWRQSGYFDLNAEEKPLLHTWSLAVEEQYYLLFPLLLMLVWGRGFRATVLVVAAIAALSLLAAEIGARASPLATFYLLPTRAWELLAGSLCALAQYGRPQQSSEALGALGLAMIVGAIVAFDASTPFPSLYALAPVLGAALIILFASQETWTGALLSNRGFVGLGLISYSAYLWHQPLFAFARLHSALPPPPEAMAALAVASIGLAYLTWRFVETPLRRPGAVRRVLPMAGAATAGLIAIASLGYLEIAAGRYRLAPIVYNATLIDVEVARAESWDAYYLNQDLAPALARFEGPDRGGRLLIAGDSHGKDLFNALHLNRDRFAGLQVRPARLGVDCLARVGRRFDARTPAQCLDAFRARHGALLEAADIVVLSPRWLAYGPPERYLPALVAALSAMGKRVAIAGATPEYAPEAPELLRRLAAGAAAPDPDAAARALFAARNPAVDAMNERLRAIAASGPALFLDKTAYVCDMAAERCDAMGADGAALYYDYGHYTLAGARRFGAKMHDLGWLDALTPPSTAVR